MYIIVGITLDEKDRAKMYVVTHKEIPTASLLQRIEPNFLGNLNLSFTIRKYYFLPSVTHGGG